MGEERLPLEVSLTKNEMYFEEGEVYKFNLPLSIVAFKEDLLFRDTQREEPIVDRRDHIV